MTAKFVGIIDEKTKRKTFINTDRIQYFNTRSNEGAEYPFSLDITFENDSGSEGEVPGFKVFKFKEEKTMNDVATNILLKHGDL